MTEKYTSNYKQYVEKWGLDAQMYMALEEMSELTKEICKYVRYNTFEKENSAKLATTLTSLKGEIADVLNTVEQLEYCFGVEEIEKIRQQKIERTNELLN